MCASSPREESSLPPDMAAPSAAAPAKSGKAGGSPGPGEGASSAALVPSSSSASEMAQRLANLERRQKESEAASKKVKKAAVPKSESRISLPPWEADASRRSVVVEQASLELTQVERQAAGRLNHASCSQPGYVPYHDKKNQDRVMVKYALCGSERMNLFGVADGHGEFGSEVADCVAYGLTTGLDEHRSALEVDPARAVGRAVKDLVTDVAASPGIDVSFSGCSVCFAVKVQSTLYVANVGTSRCVIGQHSAEAAAAGGVEPLALSVDHTPAVDAERERVLDAGGRVQPLPGPPGEDMGPDRVWLPDMDVPGLSMTRSIGDEVGHTVGVISAPEVRRHELSAVDTFCVIATEGVWQWVSNREAVNRIYRSLKESGGSPARAAQDLVALANKRWTEEEEVVADLTCVVVVF